MCGFDDAIQLKGNHNIQSKQCGATNIKLLTLSEIRSIYPWIATDTEDDPVVAGSLGVTGEGWFDAYSLMRAFRNKAKSLGVQYISGEVTGLDVSHSAVRAVKYKPTGSSAAGQPAAVATVTVSAQKFVNAAGPHAALVARMAGFELPVRARKRCVFVFECKSTGLEGASSAAASVLGSPARPLSAAPLVIDPTGVYFRPEGKHFIAGMSPPEDQDPDITDPHDVSVDHSLWESHIWPVLARRVPAFESVKLINSWSGFYDYNTFDQNAILGRPGSLLNNYYLANGFSGHGLQQSPAVGRAVAELILYENRYQTLDLSRFDFSRIQNNKPIIELNVV